MSHGFGVVVKNALRYFSVSFCDHLYRHSVSRNINMESGKTAGAHMRTDNLVFNFHANWILQRFLKKNRVNALLARIPKVDEGEAGAACQFFDRSGRRLFA